MNGSIYKRGKTYTVSFSNGFDENGNRLRYTKGGFKTKREAEKKLFELNQRYYAGELVLNDNMLLSDFLEYWLKNYVEINLAPNTITGYKNNVYKHIIPALGNMKVTKIQPVHIQEFYSQLLDNGLSATSINYIHQNLHASFEYASRMQLFHNTVFNKVKPPKKKKYIPNIMTSEECIKLINVAKDTEIYIPIIFGITLGVRRCEALGFKWCDFDYENRLLKVERNLNRVKGGMEFAPLKSDSSYRTLLLSQEVCDILKSEKARQNEFKEIFGENYNPNDLICCRLAGGWITTNYLDSQYKKLLVKNNLPIVRFHDLRHTNSTLLLEQCISPEAVAARLGHSSTSITMDIYAHTTHAMQENCADVLSKTLFT